MRERVPLRHVVAVFVGNGLEFYDFLTFSYFAVYISRTFYPGGSPSTALLATLATFGAGFLTRPIGAAAARHGAAFPPLGAPAVGPARAAAMYPGRRTPHRR